MIMRSIVKTKYKKFTNSIQFCHMNIMHVSIAVIKVIAYM